MILKFLTLLNGKISLINNERFMHLFNRVKDTDYVVPNDRDALHVSMELELDANLICNGNLIII